MSNEKQETIADIVSELRSEPFAEGGAKPWLHYLADRIEAAAKREREANREKSSQVGNAAKMREALVKSDAAFRLISKSAWFIDANFSETKKLMDAGNAIEVALAAPTRNCDVGTPEEQFKRFNMFCFPIKCRECKLYTEEDLYDCIFRWLQLPYEEGDNE